MVVVGSPTTDLLQCERYFPNSDQNKAENLIARLQVTIDLVRGFLDSVEESRGRPTLVRNIFTSAGVSPEYSAIYLVSNDVNAVGF